MTHSQIEIYFQEQLRKTQEYVSNYTILKDYVMVAGDGGTAMGTVVSAGGRCEVQGGIVYDATILEQGRMTVNAGNVSEVTVCAGGTLLLNAGASAISALGGSELSIGKGGRAADAVIYINAMATVQDGGLLCDSVQRNGAVLLSGGEAQRIAVYGGKFTVGEKSLAADIHQCQAGSLVLVQSGGRLDGLLCEGADVMVEAGGVVSESILAGYRLESGEVCHASMTLAGGAAHRGGLYVDSWSEVVAREGAVIDFTLAAAAEGKALLNDFTRISGTPDFTMTVSEKQSAGTYALAGKAAAFGAPVSLQCGEFSAMTIAAGETVTYHNSVYTLALEGGTLSADVVDFAQSGSADHLSWSDINGAESYVLELGRLQLEIVTPGMDLLGLGNGDYTWRVRNAAEADNWQDGEGFSRTEAPEGPQKLEAAANGATDLFLAKMDGAWGGDFLALNTETGEIAKLAGKARITDIFAGSEDASILVLCGGGSVAEKGAAFFLDDIYSASPVPEAQASGRLSRINDILATGGDDIIDLTSRRFAFNGGVNIHGGAGDDILWGGGNGCRLFGEEGNDSLTGTAGNDILAGGSGNDVIQCLGGEDILCFGAEWGNDLVVQQAGGKATLWFAQGDEAFWNAEDMVYSDGASSVRVVGVAATDVTLKFGNDGSELYSQLRGQGAFLA